MLYAARVAEALHPVGRRGPASTDGDVAAREARGAGLGLLGPREQLGADGAPGDGGLAVARGQRGGVAPGRGGECAVDLGGHIATDEAHLLVGGPARLSDAEIDVVDVAARAVGEECDEGWAVVRDGLQPFQLFAKNPEVVGRDRAASDAAHVVQRIGGEDRDGPSARLAERDERHRGIGRTGGLHQIFAAGRRVHLHPFDLTERAQRHGALAQVPATIEDVLRGLDAAKRDVRGAQEIRRTPHAVRDAAGHKPLVVVERLLKREAARSERRGRGVGVRARDHYVFRRDGAGFRNESPRLHTHAAVQPNQIADDEREFRMAVVEHEAACLQLVVDVLRGKRCEAADDQ